MYLFRPAPIYQTLEIDILPGERRKFWFAELGNSVLEMKWIIGDRTSRQSRSHK